MEGIQNQINMSLKDMEVIKCEECESEVFNQSIMMRRASRFVTGNPQDTIATLPVPVCAKCGHINKEFLPK
jgi:DNA-directed RNA polymerase subunit RPC12/RpoP